MGVKDMKCAIVTGASSGIGEAISKMLLTKGFEVYGIGRNFQGNIDSNKFHEVICDLLDTNKTMQILNTLPLKEVDLLINNAGCAYYGLHESLKKENISEMVRVNLEAPMIITNHLLRYIRENKGTIINIASISGTHSAAHAVAYAATKAGLISFSNSLFEEVRKHDVKVTCIIPDMTNTNLYRNADFECDTNEGCYLDVEDITRVVEEVLDTRSGVVMNEIIIRPQYNRIKKK